MSTAATPTPAPEGAHQQPLPRTAGARRPGDQPPPRGSGGALALALLLAWLALLGTGYVGWRQWQQAQGSVAGGAELTHLQHRVTALEASAAAASAGRASLDQRLDELQQANREISEQVPGLLARTRHLEDAVATLAERTQSGRDPMLLDETESLLRMAAERYRLFHDAEGAQTAYELADQTLAAVDDGAFSSVRQTIRAERNALAKSQPANRASALRQLQDLRASVASLPLRPRDQPSTTGSGGVWSRIGHALARVVRVEHDSGGPLELQDARFARELALLDLAQAQAALLGYDDQAYAAALHRVEASLATGFDTTVPAVQQARTSLQQLAGAAPTGAPVRLGAALTELRDLRAVHALGPGPGGSSLPPAASGAAARSKGTQPTPAGGSRP